MGGGGVARDLHRAALAAACLALALPGASPAAASGSLRNPGYFAFADRLMERLESTWSPELGAYRSGRRLLDSRYNAALLLVHATAAAHGHEGASRNDARARAVARLLTESPPLFAEPAPPVPDPMFHSPGWLGNIEGPYGVMDKAIDPKVAEGLQMAWRARRSLRLPRALARRIADQIERVAHTPFFRFPSVRLNQINWPAELYAYEATVTATPDLLVRDYRRQVRRFLRGVREPWLDPPEANSTNLSPTFRFHYQINRPPTYPRNLDSAEYANMTLHFIAFYDDALMAGMRPLPPREVRLLRGWVRRALFGYWMHSGFLNWDTGLFAGRWMKKTTWAFAQQGLLAIADAQALHGSRELRRWAKALFDRGLAFYRRHGRAPTAGNRFFGVPGDDSGPLFPAARMAANAMRAVSAGLGSMGAADPPPFYAFDPDVGRLAVSTPVYGTAVVAVNRGAFPYGGIELARLHDAQGDPVGDVGGRPPAAFGVVVRDAAGRPVLSSQRGLRFDPSSPPMVVVDSPRGAIRSARPWSAFPPAEPFRTLEVVGHRRSPAGGVTTRHRFTRRAIEEHWAFRRRNPGEPLSVSVLFPSWGARASIDAELGDGTVVPLASGGAPGASVPLDKVRRFRVRSTNGSYTVAPHGARRGVAAALVVRPERSAPQPGPVLELTIRQGSWFRRAELRARIAPASAARPR